MSTRIVLLASFWFAFGCSSAEPATMDASSNGSLSGKPDGGRDAGPAEDASRGHAGGGAGVGPVGTGGGDAGAGHGGADAGDAGGGALGGDAAAAGDAGDAGGDAAAAGDAGDAGGDAECAGSEVAVRTRYQVTSSPEEDGCPFEVQQRSCSNGEWGAWSGTYVHDHCDVHGHPSCGDTPHNQAEYRVRYASASVTYPSVCLPEQQYRVCTDGTLSAWVSTLGYQYATCAVDYPGCDDLPHGESRERTRYAAATVPYGEACESETQSQQCLAGTLLPWTGTYTFTACAVTPGLPCGDVPSGGTEARTRYAEGVVGAWSECLSEQQTRACNNGVFSAWSGSYSADTCLLGTGASCSSSLHCDSGRCENGACACKGKWQGAACDVCPANALADCSACRAHWQGADCTTCEAHWDSSQDCNACANHFEGNQCQSCPGRFDGADCQQCAPTWSGASCDKQQQCVRFVSFSDFGTGDGYSWRTAATSIGAGIASAAMALQDDPTLDHCEVWVRQGEYSLYFVPVAGPSVFVVPAHVELYGGFAGTETSRDQRDIAAHSTTLNGEYSYDRRIMATGDHAVVDGFTFVRGGGGNGTAIMHSQGSLTIRKCTFDRNWDRAVYIADGDVTVASSSFVNNESAIWQVAGDLTVTGSTFVGNQSSGHGSAIYQPSSSSKLWVSDSSFRANRAAGGYGGAIYASHVALERSEFRRNTAYFASSVTRGGGAIHATTLDARDCLFADNEGAFGWGFPEESRGGAIGCTDAVITGSTFAGNRALSAYGSQDACSHNVRCYGGAIACTGSIVLTNSVVWGSENANGTAIEGPLDASYSLVEGGAVGTGNLDTDPLFTDPATGDYSLAEGSPCIDAASGDAAGSADLNGTQRYDDPSVDDTGAGTPSFVDLGAFERAP